jgi:nucleotide-binding universal stress UspA family protein
MLRCSLKRLIAHRTYSSSCKKAIEEGKSLSNNKGGCKMFERILVALKFGPASLQALTKGVELARQNNAELHIFHALDYLLQDLDKSDPKLLDVKHETERRYKSEVEPLVESLKNVSFKCLPADPAMEVCKMARNIKADLIVLGCHQLREKMGMGRIDYVGMTILEKAPCPIMLVPYSE